MTEEEFESLVERAFDDHLVQEDFIQTNIDDFTEYLSDRGMEKDSPLEYEQMYLEYRDDEFLEFAAKYYASLERTGTAS